MIVKAAPITTRYTPRSKNNADPIAPMTGIGFSAQIPVIKGKSEKTIGEIPLKKATKRPKGIRNPGCIFNMVFVFSNPLEKASKQKQLRQQDHQQISPW